jgi:hypothetical protein
VLVMEHDTRNSLVQSSQSQSAETNNPDLRRGAAPEEGRERGQEPRATSHEPRATNHKPHSLVMLLLHGHGFRDDQRRSLAAARVCWCKASRGVAEMAILEGCWRRAGGRDRTSGFERVSAGAEGAAGAGQKASEDADGGCWARTQRRGRRSGRCGSTRPSLSTRARKAEADSAEECV